MHASCVCDVGRLMSNILLQPWSDGQTKWTMHQKRISKFSHGSQPCNSGYLMIITVDKINWECDLLLQLPDNYNNRWMALAQSVNFNFYFYWEMHQIVHTVKHDGFYVNTLSQTIHQRMCCKHDTSGLAWFENVQVQQLVSKINNHHDIQSKWNDQWYVFHSSSDQASNMGGYAL